MTARRATDTLRGPADHLAEPIREETTPALNWHGSDTVRQWIVRRLVPGPDARDGEELTNQLDRLRRTSTMLAVVRAGHDYRLACDHGLTDREHLPAKFDNFSPRFPAIVR